MRYFLPLLLTLFVSTLLEAQTFRWDTPSTKTTETAAISTKQMDPRQVSARSPLAEKEVETGYATYYADYLHGQPTAFGEIYRREQLTAAHRSLPLGTLLKVTRLDNGSSVTVRVNDQAPLCNGCVVSLSYAAAQQIDLVRAGKTRVAAQVVGHSNSNPAPRTVSEPMAARSYSSTTQPTQQQRVTLVPTNTSTYNYPYDYEAHSSRNPTVVPESRSVRSRSAAPSNTPQSYERPEYNLPYRANNAPRETQPTTEYNSSYYTNNTSREPRPAVTEYNYAPSQTTGVPVAVNNPSGYGVQLGAFRNYGNAQRQVASLQQRGLSGVFIQEDRRSDGSVLNRVVVGPYQTMGTAQQQLRMLQSQYQLEGIVMQLTK